MSTQKYEIQQTSRILLSVYLTALFMVTDVSSVFRYLPQMQLHWAVQNLFPPCWLKQVNCCITSFSGSSVFTPKNSKWLLGVGGVSGQPGWFLFKWKMPMLIYGNSWWSIHYAHITLVVLGFFWHLIKYKKHIMAHLKQTAVVQFRASLWTDTHFLKYLHTLKSVVQLKISALMLYINPSDDLLAHP